MLAFQHSQFTSSLFKKVLCTLRCKDFYFLLIALQFVLVSGCHEGTKDEQNVTTPEVVEPPFKLSGKLTELQPISGVLSVGGFNLISEATALLKTGVTSFLATPLELRSLWLDNYVQTELMFNPKFIDSERPFRVIQIAHNGGVYTVRVVGIKDIPGLKKTLGSHVETFKQAEGIVYIQNRYKGDKAPLHFIEIGQGLIASTDHIDLLKSEYLNYYRQVGSCRVEGLLNVIFYPKQATTLNHFKRSQDVIDQLELKGSGKSVARQKGMLRSLANLGRQLAEDSVKTVLTLTLDKPRITFDLDWTFKPDSLSKSFVNQLSGGEHSLLKYVGGAATLLSLKLPSPLLTSLVQEWNKVALRTISAQEIEAAKSTKVKSTKDTSTKRKKTKKKKAKRSKQAKSLPALLGTSEEQITEYIQLISSASSVLGGEIVLAALPKPRTDTVKPKIPPTTKETDEILDDLSIFTSSKSKRRLDWLGLFTHQGQADLSDKLDAVLNIYRDPLIKRAMRQRGMSIKITNDKPLKIGEQIIKSTHIKPRMPRTPKSIRPLRPQLKELYDGHIWIAQAFGAVGFALSWKDTFTRLIKIASSEQATTPSHGQTLNNAYAAGINNPTLFMYVDPITTVTSLKKGKSGSILLPLQMMFDPIKPTEGISISVGKSQNGAQVRLMIPHLLLKSIKSGMSGEPVE